MKPLLSLATALLLSAVLVAPEIAAAAAAAKPGQIDEGHPHQEAEDR
jgi:hypothetical protein